MFDFHRRGEVNKLDSGHIQSWIRPMNWFMLIFWILLFLVLWLELSFAELYNSFSDDKWVPFDAVMAVVFIYLLAVSLNSYLCRRISDRRYYYLVVPIFGALLLAFVHHYSQQGLNVAYVVTTNFVVVKIEWVLVPFLMVSVFVHTLIINMDGWIMSLKRHCNTEDKDRSPSISDGQEEVLKEDPLNPANWTTDGGGFDSAIPKGIVTAYRHNHPLYDSQGFKQTDNPIENDHFSEQ